MVVEDLCQWGICELSSFRVRVLQDDGSPAVIRVLIRARGTSLKADSG